MAKQPTVSSDSVAQDQIRAFVERILRMKEEAKAINDDIREIYAEAKGNGFDKTVLGQVVSYVEKRSKDNASLLEREALFDLYISAFDGVGTDRATHTHEGRSNSPTSRPSADVAADAGTQPAGTAGEASARASSAPNSHPVANVGEGANGAIAAASDDPASREDDDADRQQLATSGFTGDEAVAPQTSVRDAADEPGTGAPAAISEPDKAGGGAGASSPAPSTVIQLRAMPERRPHCLNRTACASMSQKHCHRCQTALAAQLAVEAGGKSVEHHGLVG